MSTLVTQQAPNFTATAVTADNKFEEIGLSDYRGKYGMLSSSPLDFTFVCPSEILAFDHKLEEFRKRDCELIGVSVDSHFTHLAWKKIEIEKVGIGNIQYPLVSDLKKEVEEQYGVLHDGSVALRGLFLIDKQGVVRHVIVNDLPLGRNVNEALRTLDALRFTEEHGVVCQANWREGAEAMKPTAEGVAEYLAKHEQ